MDRLSRLPPPEGDAREEDGEAPTPTPPPPPPLPPPSPNPISPPPARGAMAVVAAGESSFDDWNAVRVVCDEKLWFAKERRCPGRLCAHVRGEPKMEEPLREPVREAGGEETGETFGGEGAGLSEEAAAALAAASEGRMAIGREPTLWERGW